MLKMSCSFETLFQKALNSIEQMVFEIARETNHVLVNVSVLGYALDRSFWANSKEGEKQYFLGQPISPFRSVTLIIEFTIFVRICLQRRTKSFQSIHPIPNLPLASYLLTLLDSTFHPYSAWPRQQWSNIQWAKTERGRSPKKTCLSSLMVM